MIVYDLTAERLLLKEVSEGSSEAFTSVFHLYKGKLFSFVNSFVQNAADTEEIVQDVFLVVWKNREMLQNIEHPRNYIYTIARNKTYDYLNKASRNKKAVQDAWINASISLNNIDEQICLKESAALVNRVLKKLSPQKQKIFSLSREQYLSHEKIAEEVGLSKSRVKNVIVEVLKHIKYHVLKNTIIVFMSTLLCW